MISHNSSNILKFLETQRIDNDVFYSHVSMINPCGKFQFNRENFEKFMDLYCDTLIENEFSEKEIILGIAEKPNQHYMPVLADFDIKIQEDNIEIFGEHIYTEDHVGQVIQIYQSVLKEIIDECTDKNLYCILLEKPIYYITNNNSTYSKNGFHLHFFNCFLSKVDQEVHLFPRVKEKLINMRVFEDLGIEDSSKVFDTCTCKVPWLLYGSRKSEKMDYYKVTKVFDANCQEIELEEAFDGYELFNMHEELIDIKGKVKYYLPRILSIIPYNRETCELKNGLPSPLKDKNPHAKNARKAKTAAVMRNKSAIERDLKISERLLPMLAQYRSSDFNDWMTIGWILYNIGEGCDEALEQWIEFSARDEDKFDESRCIMEWDRMIRKDLTLGSLRHYAKTDNPDMYNDFKHEEGQKYVMKSLDGSHHDIAKLLYEEFGTEFVCSSITNKVWYQFRDNKWEEIEEGKFLRDKISDEVVQKFVVIGGGHFSGASGSDKAEERFHQEKIKQTQKLIANLKNSNYKNAVMRECCDVFYNRFFKQKLDTNPYLIAFANGVYDLKLNIFRPGKPEDFLSKSMPIDYIDFDETDNRLLEVYDFLEKIFPDKSVRQYFTDQASDIFVGGNHQKVVLFWTGEGDNGKSIMQMVFEKMLGELSINFPTTLITGKKVANGAANPDLARAGQGVRLATICEPDGDEQINIGMLKSLSGNDSYLARDLFEKGKQTKEVSPLFKLYFICLDSETSISLSNGISVSINKLIDNKQKILSWDSETDGLLNTSQNAFIDKGKQECMTFTLLDGREITCTPNHKFLTNDNKWIEAQHIKIGETQLKMGIDYPKCDDIFENYIYTLYFGEYIFNLEKQDQRLKGMAYVRLLGYMLRDGSLNKLYPDHKIDGENILLDIKLLTGKNPSLFENKNVWQISLPEELVRSFNTITEMQKGENYIILPNFIFEEKCPSFIIREFLASMFGRYGSLLGNNFNNIQLVASEIEENVDNLFNIYKNISKLLLDRFDIESYVTKEEYISQVGKRFHVFLNITNNDSILKFCENIGVRYSCYKSYIITALGSYFRYKKSIIKRNAFIINRTKEIYEKQILSELGYNTLINSHKQSIEEIKNKMGLINEKYIVTYDQIRRYISDNIECEIPSIDIKEYLDATNLFKFCIKDNHSINTDRNTLPCYNMNVIFSKNVGVKHVFDINIDEPYSNFLAEGVVSHNCNKLPNLKYSDKATWNRIRVIPFESTFVRPGQPCPDTYEEQMKQKRFPMDPTFANKIPNMVQAFAWMLLQHRQKITTRVEPEKVRQATLVYQKMNDSYRQFIEENMMDHEESQISLAEIYAIYKEWFKEGFPGHSLPVKNDLKEYFTKLWGEPEIGTIWRGHRQKGLNDELTEGKTILLGQEDIVDYDIIEE